MYLLSRFDSLVDSFAQSAHRGYGADTAFFGHFPYRGDGAVPYDVVDVYLVAEKRLVAVVGIYHADQAVTVLAEKVKERTVLAKLVGICRIVHRAVVVTEQDDKSLSHQVAKLGATADVCFFGKEHKRRN